MNHEHDQFQSRLCQTCMRTRWHELTPEELDGHPHQPSRAALEASAKECPLCTLVLRAAITNSQSSQDSRYGKGIWRHIEYLDGVEGGKPLGRKIKFRKDFGSCAPSKSPWHVPSNGVRPVFAGSGPVGLKLVADFSRGLKGHPYISPSGRVNHEREHIEAPSEEIDIGSIDINDSTKDMPVWVYGNWWASDEGSQTAKPSMFRLMGVGARFGRSGRMLDAVNNEPYQVHIRGSNISVATEDGDQLNKRIPGRLVELNSASPKALERVKNWISHCKANHPWCEPLPTNSVLPTRVIDVAASDGSVAVMNSNGAVGQYVALSHCWGTSYRLTATTESINDLRKGIEITRLPKTFRDAVSITKTLGIRYLWIDCLCIIQDDPADWEREAATMGQVYHNAYLTISATNSTDSTYGCFPDRTKDSYVSPGTMSLGYDKPRKTRSESSASVLITDRQSKNELSKMHFFEEWLPGSMLHAPQQHTIGSFGKLVDPIAGSPLSSRGWTLQERLLSQRTVHYERDQMFFECETSIIAEDGFVFPCPDSSFNRLLYTQNIKYEQHGMTDDGGLSFVQGKYAQSSPPMRDRGGWLSLVSDFSRRNLTRSEDKLPALAGLARLLSQKTGDKYFAGIWGRHVYEDLAWRVYRQEEYTRYGEDRRVQPIKGKVVGEVSKPSEYRAPSWSWASLDAPVKFVPLSYRSIVAEARGCDIQPAGTDAFGRVVSGMLDIAGPLFQVFPYRPRNPFDRHGTPVYVDLGGERGKCIGTVHLDLPDSEIQYPCYALFLDPSNALVVRSNGVVSAIIQSVLPPETLASLVNDGTLLDTIGVREQIASNPDMKDQVQKCLFDVERIGLAEFVLGQGTKNADGFWSSDTAKDEDILKPAVELDVSGLSFDQFVHTSGSQSWGPVRIEDEKVWVTIV